MSVLLPRGLEYMTTFSLVESPISEGGRWITGASVGLDWSNMDSNGAGAYGTQASPLSSYNDAMGHLLPPPGQVWYANYDLQAQVAIIGQPFQGFNELELHGRATLTPHSCKMYEVIASVGPTAYMEIVLWYGPLGVPYPGGGGAFRSLSFNNLGTPPVLTNGDWFRATFVGPIITGYYRAAALGPEGNWTAYVNADIRVDPVQYWYGNPGIGGWRNANGGTPAPLQNFRISRFSVKSIVP